MRRCSVYSKCKADTSTNMDANKILIAQADTDFDNIPEKRFDFKSVYKENTSINDFLYTYIDDSLIKQIMTRYGQKMIIRWMKASFYHLKKQNIVNCNK